MQESFTVSRHALFSFVTLFKTGETKRRRLIRNVHLNGLGLQCAFAGDYCCLYLGGILFTVSKGETKTDSKRLAINRTADVLLQNYPVLELTDATRTSTVLKEVTLETIDNELASFYATPTLEQLIFPKAPIHFYRVIQEKAFRYGLQSSIALDTLTVYRLKPDLWQIYHYIVATNDYRHYKVHPVKTPKLKRKLTPA